MDTRYFSESFNPESMPFIHQRSVKVNYVIALGSLIFLFVITSINTNPLFLDESVFVKNMPLFKQNGLSVKFLTEMYDQAPGPLYQMVHSAFEPFTNLKSPGIRLVNVVFFILVIINTGLILRLTHIDGPILLIALNLIAVPVIWQVAGMALTEIPALFFATLSVLILGFLIKQKQLTAVSFVLSVLAGTCLGAAILGRTPYLMLIPAICILAYNPFTDAANRHAIAPLLIGVSIVTALAICLPVFIVWKGLVPPYQAVISEGGIRVWHGVLAFAYSGIIVLFIAPKWFKMNKSIALGLSITLSVFSLLNFFWFEVKYLPVYGFLSKHLPGFVMDIYAHLISPILMVFAAYFVYNLILYMRRHRQNSFYLSIALSLAFVLTTCVKITHLFTSRYVAQAVPFLIILLAEKDTFDKYRILRLSAGIVLGYISLQTYVYP